MKNKLCSLQEQSYLFCYLEFKHKELFMHRAAEASFFAKNSSSITRIKFCRNYAIGKIPQ